MCIALQCINLGFPYSYERRLWLNPRGWSLLIPCIKHNESQTSYSIPSGLCYLNRLGLLGAGDYLRYSKLEFCCHDQSALRCLHRIMVTATQHSSEYRVILIFAIHPSRSRSGICFLRHILFKARCFCFIFGFFKRHKVCFFLFFFINIIIFKEKVLSF